MTKLAEKIILGIDPGTNIMGFGIIKTNNNKIELLVMDVLRLDKLTDHTEKLKHIFNSCLRLIETFNPTELAIEAPFYGKNVQSMLKLGRAQGVSIAAALYKNLKVYEYSPRKVKMSITGKGAASKEQVAAMLLRTLNLKEEPKYFDATDAVAVALCHYYQKPIDAVEKGFNSWKSFISANPDRVKK